MSDSAPKHFADIASALGPLLDNHKPEKTNQTLLTLFDLGEQLPQNSSLRQVITKQMAHILSFDFPVNPDTTNKTLVVMGQIKDALPANDSAHVQIDTQMARVLTAKLEKLNGQGGKAPAATPAPAPAPKQEAAQPAPAAEPRPQVEYKPAPAPQPQPEPKPEPKPEVDELADAAHKLQLSLDQMSDDTRKAFPEFAPIYEHGGTAKSYVDYLKANSKGQDSSVKIELDKLLLLAEKIEAAPAEAGEFQVLYDQVDAKHKDPKTGVFSIFQRDYGGNAYRFAVERTAQYAKYVDAEESRQRMIEDLHKLIEQANKNLSEVGQKSAPAGNDAKPANSGRAFMHG